MRLFDAEQRELERFVAPGATHRAPGTHRHARERCERRLRACVPNIRACADRARRVTTSARLPTLGESRRGTSCRCRGSRNTHGEIEHQQQRRHRERRRHPHHARFETRADDALAPVAHQLREAAADENRAGPAGRATLTPTMKGCRSLKCADCCTVCAMMSNAATHSPDPMSTRIETSVRFRVAATMCTTRCAAASRPTRTARSARCRASCAHRDYRAR